MGIPFIFLFLPKQIVEEKFDLIATSDAEQVSAETKMLKQ